MNATPEKEDEDVWSSARKYAPSVVKGSEDWVSFESAFDPRSEGVKSRGGSLVLYSGWSWRLL